MADQKDDAAAETHVASDKEKHAALADLGPELPAPMRELAEKLPEKDDVQKAYKAQMLAEDMHVAAKQKVKIVDASPDADDTPSGYALKKVAGIAHDGDRGEAYAREKSAKRWGYVPAAEA
jgi:hypothetical protein